MKRKLQILLVIIVSILTFPLSSFAYSFEVDGIYYNYISTIDKTCEVTYGDVKYDGDIEIPSSVIYENKKMSVIKIAEMAFYKCSSLSSVVIPNSVTQIGEDAFKGCSSLASVNIPDSVITIEHGAFEDCSSLASLNIPNSVTSIESYAFKGCSSLTSIIIANSVTYIGNVAFNNCSSLTSIVIPNSVTYIGDATFEKCSSLNSIVIPNSVTHIGERAFEHCSALNSIDIPDSITSIRFRAFAGCSSLNSVIIPNSVTSIGSSAFQGCSSLNSIEMLSTARIGKGVFKNCTSLTSIVLPNYIIGDEVFQDCSSLISIDIPYVRTIGASAFQGCSSLSSIDLPDSLTGIGASAFQECSSLTSIVIPNSVTSIGVSAFQGCSSLTSIKLSGHLKGLNANVFRNCKNLDSLCIPCSVKYICFDCHPRTGDDFCSFEGCDNLKYLRVDYSPNLLYPYRALEGTESSWSTLDETIWRNELVREFTNQIEYLYIDRELSSNGGLSLSSLTNLIIGENISKLQIHGNTTPNLSVITSYAATPPFNVNFTETQYTDVIVKVPNSSLEAYKNADGWKNFWNIEGFEYSGIDEVNSDFPDSSLQRKETARYNLNGQPVSEDYKGVVIVRFSDGTTKKIMQ